MMARTFISTAEVADLLGVSAQGFLRNRARLEDELGFPEAMPHRRRPLIWRRDQVETWIDGQGTPREDRIDPALVAAGKVALLAEARRV